MTKEQLAEIKARAEAATPGPWEYIERKGFPTITSEGFRQSSEPWFDISGDEDAIFCAHARTDIPALLAEVERLKTEVSNADYERNMETSRLSAYVTRLEAAHIAALKELHSHLLHGSHPSVDVEYNETQYIEAEMAKLRE